MTPVSLLFKTIYNYRVTSNDYKRPENAMNPPLNTEEQHQNVADVQKTAAHFVTARQQAQPLTDFPGAIPNDLQSAYQIQDAGIDLWTDRIGGWKVGRIPPDIEDDIGIDRLAGPIFASTIHHAKAGAVLDMPMFVGGFGAIEAEYVAVIGADAPADKLTWSLDEALAMIADLRIGLEIASSPLATINELGPTVVVADFGNNHGLVVGPSISNWSSRDLDTMNCKTWVDDECVGDGGAFTLTGGFVRSVQFLLEIAATRNRPLRAGDVIATGQTTGIHDVRPGQIGCTDFGDDGKLVVRMTEANPLQP